MILAEIDLRGADWKKRGACVTLDPELMWPTGPTDPRIPVAKRVCRRCPIRSECLARAEPYGIWGGKTEEER